MDRRAWLVVLAGCGRISFDPVGGGDGGMIDSVIVDGITVTAPCGTPTQIGQGTVATPLRAATNATSYRVTWLDGTPSVHLLGIERTGDTIVTRELVLAKDIDIPVPTGADVSIASDTYLLYWNGVQSDMSALRGPTFQLVHGVGTSQQVAIQASGTRVFALSTQNKLYAFVWDTSLGLITFPQVDQQMTLDPTLAAASASAALITSARPTLANCTAWTYSSTGALLGSVALPGDGTRCDPITGAYASIDDVLAVAYGYQSGTPPAIRLQALSASAQLVGAPATVATGTEPKLGSTGSHFYVAYRTATSPTSYQLLTLSSAFATQGMTPLHVDGTMITQATIASADTEAIAVWTEPSGMPSAPDAIWMRRLCGP